MPKKVSFIPVIFLFALCLEANAHAYVPGIHFYMTFVLSTWCGLDQISDAPGVSEAYLIAWGDRSVDAFKDTDAGANPDEWLDPSKFETRRLYHFAVRPKTDDRVVRGSSWAMQTADLAISKAEAGTPEPVLFGIGLHTLQDSFSHEGYGPTLGHWTFSPDYPDSDVPKALEAAELTWNTLDRWSMANYGYGCSTSFSNVSGILEAWLSERLNSSSAIFNEWRKNAEALAGRSLPDNLLNQDSEWVSQFQQGAKEVVALKTP